MHELSKTYASGMSWTTKSVLAALFRRKLLICWIFGSIFALTAIVTFLLPKQYESSMKLLVKSERAELVVSPDARESSLAHSEVTETQVNSEIELLGSYDLLGRVVRACKLAADNSKTESIESAIRKLKRDLKITPVRKTDIIEVTYSAPSPQLATAVLKEVSKDYLDIHLRVHRSAGTQEFFRGQATRFQTELTDAETRLNEFSQRNNLTSIAEQKELLVHKLLDEQTSLNEARIAAAESFKRTSELRGELAGQTPRVVTQSRKVPNQYSVERLNTMLAELENRRTQALMKFRPEDRTVVEINEEIANTTAALDSASKMISTEQVSDLNPLHTSLESDLAREELSEAGLKVRCQGLTEAIAGYHARLAQLELNSIQYEDLQRSSKEFEDSYLLYARKEEEARIADSLDQQKVANVVVAEAPVEHYLPTKPHVGLSLLIGCLFACIVSLGAGLGVEYAEGRIYTPAEMEASTGVPVLATVAWVAA